MCNHYYALAVFVDLREYIQNILSGSRIELARRLIRKKDLRIIDNRSYDADSLSLTTGQLVRILIPHFLSDADLGEEFLCLFGKLG